MAERLGQVGSPLRSLTMPELKMRREKDGIPAESVGTALEGDFGAANGHDGEESVAGDEVPGSERVLPWGA